MKLYLISQYKFNNYDTYSSAVVCAENEEEAKNMHPNGHDTLSELKNNFFAHYNWARDIEDVQVEYLGEADSNIKKGVICASYRSG